MLVMEQGSTRALLYKPSLPMIIPPPFESNWNPKNDCSLLLGSFAYGYDALEAILGDPGLDLGMATVSSPVRAWINQRLNHMLAMYCSDDLAPRVPFSNRILQDIEVARTRRSQ